MVLYHKWGVKTGFSFALQLFLLISDSLGGVTASCNPGSDGPAFHLKVTMGHRLRKSFVRNAFIPDLEVNNKSKGYGVSQRLKNPKARNQIKKFENNP